jgi:AcrR family transcriptional regulator
VATVNRPSSIEPPHGPLPVSLEKPPLDTPVAPDQRDFLRERLLAAAIDVVAQCGYHSATAADIAQRAGCPHSSFSREFTSEEECVLAAFDSFVRQLSARLVSVCGRRSSSSRGYEETLRAALTTLMHTLATRRSLSWVCLVEIPAAGPRAIAHWESALSSFACLLADSLPDRAPDRLRSPEVSRALVGGISSLAYDRLVNCHVDALEGLTDSLVCWLLSYTKHPAFVQPVQSSRPLTARANARYPTTSAVPFPQHMFTDSALYLPIAALTARRQIIKATAAVISEHGYHAATVAEIAAAADNTTHSFYRHFPDKASAALAAVDEWCRYTFQCAADSCQSGASPTVGVANAIASLVQTLKDQPSLARLAMVDVLALEERGRSAHNHIRQRLTDILTFAFTPPPSEHIALHATVGALMSALRSYTLQLAKPSLPDPTSDLTFIALAPFAGAAAAMPSSPTLTWPER